MDPFLLLRSMYASGKQNGDLRAPYVEIFDARGCDAKNAQYTGPKSNDMNDDQCVKVSMAVPKVSEETAAKKLQEFLGLKQVTFIMSCAFLFFSCFLQMMHLSLQSCDPGFIQVMCIMVRTTQTDIIHACTCRPPSTLPRSLAPPRSTKRMVVRRFCACSA
jgi:hypothetical protein